MEQCVFQYMIRNYKTLAVIRDTVNDGIKKKPCNVFYWGTVRMIHATTDQNSFLVLQQSFYVNNIVINESMIHISRKMLKHN